MLSSSEIGKIKIGPEQGNCIGLFGVAVNPFSNRVYISNIHSSNIAVVDGKNEEFVGTIKLTDKECHIFTEICFNPVNEQLYVIAGYLNRVWVVDSRTEKVTDNYEMGPYPYGLTSDSITGKTYVALGGDSALAVLDSDNRLLTKIPVKPWPYPVAVDPQRHRAYVVSQMANMALYRGYDNPVGYPSGVLNIIDTRRDMVIGEVKVERRSCGVAVNPDSGLVYVANRVDESVLVIDPEKKKIVKRLKTQCGPWGMCIYPEKKKLYVINWMGEWYDTLGQPTTVTVIDTGLNEVIKHFPVGKLSCNIAVNPVNERAYVPNGDDMNLSIIDTNRDEESSRITGFGLTVDGMEFNSKTNRMYIPAHFIESVLTIDTKKLKIVGDVRFGSWGVACAVNEKTDRIYFNNSEEGTVHVIDGKTNHEVTWANLGVGSDLMHRLWAGIACDERRGMVYAVLTRLNGLVILKDEPEKNRLQQLGHIYLGESNMRGRGLSPGAIYMGVAVNRKTGIVYVYNAFQRILSRVNPEQYKVTNQLDMSGLRLPMTDPGTPGYLRKYATHYVINTDDKRNLVYANNFIIDGENLQIRGNLPKEKVTGVQLVDNNKNRLYAHGIRGMTVMDPETYEELLFIPHGCPEKPDSELRVLWGVDSTNDRLYLQRHMFLEGDVIRVFELNNG